MALFNYTPHITDIEFQFRIIIYTTKDMTSKDLDDHMRLGTERTREWYTQHELGATL